MACNIVYFAHGKESGPWGEKITRLAQVARGLGFSVESPDYSGMDDPAARVARLLSLRPSADCLILAGSSMGGYVSLAASRQLKVDGLFLLAPAVGIPHYPEQDPAPQSRLTTIVHGWQDDLIPPERVARFAQKYSCELHLLNSDHRLSSALTQIEVLFANFLKRVCLT